MAKVVVESMPKGTTRYDEASIIRLASSHIQRNLPALLPKEIPQTALIRQIGSRVRGSSFGAYQHLAAKAKRLIDSTVSIRNLDDCGHLFGPDWRHHPLRHQPRLHGYTTHEPHLTKTLGRFLEPAPDTAVGSSRAGGFLTAIYQAASKSNAGNRTSIHNLEVRTEVPVDQAGSRRIDLLLRWDEDSATRVVVIEVKFGHHVLSDTLPKYRKYGQRLAGASGRCDCFLIGLGRDPAVRQNRSWSSITWFDLLRRWESQIMRMTDDDNDFTRFRSELWQRCRNRRC